jgi:aminoglycoside 6'-N-acetyltransferase I
VTLPNKPLKLSGNDVLCGGAHELSFNDGCALRASRPQLKHDPLGGSPSMITVRPATPRDAPAWLQLRHALWPEGSEAEHREDIERFFAGDAREPLAVLLAEDGAGCPVGLAELSIRASAEGCRSDRVAYLEGWLVLPKARGQGVGRALIVEAEKWGRSQGCREFASDAQPDNEVSAAAHRALGFVEVGLVRCFRKDL